MYLRKSRRVGDYIQYRESTSVEPAANKACSQSLQREAPAVKPAAVPHRSWAWAMAISKRKHTTSEKCGTVLSGSENSRVSDLITSHLLHALSDSQCCFDYTLGC